MQKSLIIALDFPSKVEVSTFLAKFKNEKLYLKVGMELFYQEGPEIIKFLQDQGHDIFLDLKLHDIPHTVYQAMKGLAKLGVTMTNVHAAGGREMMQAALEGLQEGSRQNARPDLIAVTQLTSTSENRMRQELLINHNLNDVVLHYARNACESGLDGVVCSSLEAPILTEHLGETFKKVTPGIRLKDDDKADQSRIVTPADARKFGATEIVVGRSITKAQDPLKAYQTILQQWQGVEII
ncbi:orotidine-5'-phosphate decarboxylase [Sutcliffiella halmapala]|uniref:orotidine-5'-phosphate decarboxylase n=1 Tax=Sutcliffiella halmapala TaxID=79882 RepID=UPI000994ABF8|nr:orotidine-5'-phosphate decarboxylase [Sutcliffiella halmapala]